MPSSMDKSHSAPAVTPGYETRDADVRGVFNFLVILGVVLLLVALLCWGVFRYFSAMQAKNAIASPFSDIRQIPSGLQLQVNPRQDFLAFQDEQRKALETYTWENRAAGTVRVPIELAKKLLLQKGLPVESETPPAPTEKTAPKGNAKP